MINFFRRIRKKLADDNKPLKYMRYAIGEIVLVVIGILIALQINNWNETRNLKKEEKLILGGLAEDLIDDKVGLENVIGWLKSRQGHVDSVLAVIENPDIEVDSASLVHWLITSGYILDYIPVYPTYNEILGSGKLSIIESQIIKKKLASYKSIIDNNTRVMKSYDEGIKQIEKKVISYMSSPPPSQYYGDNYIELNKSIGVDRYKLAQDDELIALLKHNAYHTQIEINIKAQDFIPMADTLINLIYLELDKN